MLPDPTRADAAVVLIGEWTSTDPEAELDWLAAEPLPEGCQFMASYRCTDGVNLLHYSQWTTSTAARAHAATAPIPVTEFRHYRSRVDTTGPVGCVVIAQLGIAVADPQWLRDFVDRMFTTGEEADAAGMVIPGLLAAHFYFSIDGTDIRNYAEWTDPGCHRAMTGADESPAWKRYLPRHARTL
ncbi:hypothetical protein [Crossiella sp. CA198]|uniref:hypothetical protein n=1 Tax=Crossiella sp. CA198 TaxID=3455607 RepID=UPI003F8D77F9